MASTYIRQKLTSGSGSFRAEGQRDQIERVLQVDESGLHLNASNEKANPISEAQAKAASVSPSGMALDRTEVRQYNGAPSALLWEFYWSNNGYHRLDRLGDDVDAVVQATFNSNRREISRPLPVLILGVMAKPALPVPIIVPIWKQRVITNRPPESVSIWKVRAQTEEWNQQIEVDVATRMGDIHKINGNIYKFLGSTSVERRRREGDPNAPAGGTEYYYEVDYAWEVDPGTGQQTVSSDQPPGTQFKLPPVLASGDPALSVPGHQFAGERYTRLPFHEIVHGEPEEPGDEPPFLQIKTARFDPSRYDDWQALPGQPVSSL